MPSYKYKPGEIIRFTYKHKYVDADTGDQYKEVLVLNPFWMGKVHAIDLKRLTAAERETLRAIFDSKTKPGKHRFPIVNDILRRMKPLEEVKNPHAFYYKFVKVFLRHKDAYRQYEHMRMQNPTVVKISAVKGGTFNPKPLFHKVESKPKHKPNMDLIKKVAQQMGVGVSKNAGKPGGGEKK